MQNLDLRKNPKAGGNPLAALCFRTLNRWLARPLPGKLEAARIYVKWQSRRSHRNQNAVDLLYPDPPLVVISHGRC